MIPSHEQIKFINVVTNAEIAASGKQVLDLKDIQKNFGNNYNTLTIINTSTTSAINVFLDGIEVAYITPNNGSWSFDWEYGLIFSSISIENTDAVNVVAAAELKISVGRTGVKQ